MAVAWQEYPKRQPIRAPLSASRRVSTGTSWSTIVGSSRVSLPEIQQWMDAKRASLAAQKSALQQNLTEHKEQLQHNLAEAWEHATLRSRFKELEYTLKMQRKRLQMLNTQMA